MPNELLGKLEGQLTAIHTRQEQALAKAEGDGVTEADRTAALAEFDAAETEKTKVNASLGLAQNLHTEQEEAAKPPTTSPIVLGPSRRSQAQPRQIVLAAHQPHGPLRYYRGEGARERASETGLGAAAVLWNHQPTVCHWPPRWCPDGQPMLLPGLRGLERWRVRPTASQ